ncbi:MAG TPA: ATPase P [Bacteroidetes bacterium]|nr:ATPase P [Bacteroidota bacterium]
MITVEIPGWGKLELAHLVLDYNGTLAVDGALLPGVAERLERLSAQLQIHVVTADTFGKVREQMRGLPCEVVVLPPGNQDRAKEDFVRKLGAGRVAAMGNGRNDRLMLRTAALGVCTLQEEGVFSGTLRDADVVVCSILDGLDLLLNPLRLVATLRS